MKSYTLDSTRKCGVEKKGLLRKPGQKNGALTFYFGGNEVTTLQFGSTKSQGKRFANQFEKIIPSVKRVAIERFLRTQWTQDAFTKGSYTSFQPGQITDFADFFCIESDNLEESQDVNIGTLVFAGEHLSDEFYGNMNGAAHIFSAQ
jgi:monoamine oxidase